MAELKDKYAAAPDALTAAQTDEFLALRGGEFKLVTLARMLARTTSTGGAIAPVSGELDLTAQDGNAGSVSGTANITSIVLEEGRHFYLTVAHADGLSFINHATNLPINGKTDLKGLQNDVIHLIGGAGNVGKVVDIEPAAVQGIPRVTTITTSVGFTPDYDTTDEFYVTAQNGDMSFDGVDGTPRDGQSMIIRVNLTSVGAATLSWASVFRFLGVAQPVSLVGPLEFILYTKWNATTSKVVVDDIKFETNVVVDADVLSDALDATLAVAESYTDTAISTTALKANNLSDLANQNTALTNLGILRSFRNTDFVINANDTLATTGISVTVAAGGVYKVEIDIYISLATMGLQFDIGGTATVNNFRGQYLEFNTGVSPVDDARIVRALTVTARADVFAQALNNPDGYVKFVGTVDVNAGGTFFLRAAQITSDPSDSTVNRGSPMVLTKLN